MRGNKKILTKENKIKADKIEKNQNLTEKVKICQDKGNINTIDIIVLILIFTIIKRYIIDPFLMKKMDDGRGKFLKVLYHYYIRYLKKYPIVTLLFFTLLFFLLKNKDSTIQNIGITTIIVLIVSFFQEANELLMGAIFAAISTYIFVRLKYKIICVDD